MIEIAKTEIYQTCSTKSTIFMLQCAQKMLQCAKKKQVTESVLVLNLPAQVFKACFARREAKNEEGQLGK